MKAAVLENEIFLDEYMETILVKAIKSIQDIYRFLNIYLVKVVPKHINTAVFSDASVLSSGEEN